ncbi:MAG: hypothetical protein N3E49_04230 [Bacteroidia bacterium]|nr:hypothetical protein [Bacteroidia bacterium]
MLSVFACPRAFSNSYIAAIQRKAIQSWLRLHSQVEVILMGRDEGVAEVSQEFGLRYIPEIEYNERGVPILSSLFRLAAQHSSYDLLVYTNADILISSRLVKALQAIQQRWKNFLLVSAPWIISYDEVEEVNGNETLLIQRAHKSPTPSGVDIFAFSKSTYWKVFVQMPPFLVGRLAWDFWLMAEPVLRGIPAIDGTDYVTIFHPDDRRSTHYLGAEQAVVYTNHPDMQYNATLSDVAHQITRLELPYELDAYGRLISRVVGGRWGGWLRQNYKKVLDQTASWRYRLGLYRWWQPAPWREAVRTGSSQKS